DDDLAAMLAEFEEAEDSPFDPDADSAIDLDELIASLDEEDVSDEVDLDELLAELSQEQDETPAPTVNALDDLLGYDA
ncbi:hypothetical protein, partial [Klebsiella pneumoniae]|uniref:hypothetical protein n=1 Tax=Klebsiella pneumoniae TaxID=573 RepID=UPI00273051D0